MEPFVRIARRLILLTAVVVSAWFIVYPAPSLYYWDETATGRCCWRPYDSNMKRLMVLEATTLADRAALKEELSRRFFTDYEPFGGVRADYRRMVVELGSTWLIALGLVLVVKPAK